MAVIINATTTTGLTTSADNSGVIQFQSNGANTVGISSTGYITVGGNQQIYGPSFSAGANSGVALSNTTFTKLPFQVEDFDTNNNYNNSTYVFTPTVPGYYIITARAQFTSSVGTSETFLAVYKNGTEFKRGTGAAWNAAITAMVYCNGSTDYIEIYGYQASGGTVNMNGASPIYSTFAGSMVRGA